MVDIDRSAVNTCLSKAIAYQQVGKTEEAEDWARELIAHLQLAGILIDRLAPDIGECDMCHDTVTADTGIPWQGNDGRTYWGCLDCSK